MTLEERRAWVDSLPKCPLKTDRDSTWFPCITEACRWWIADTEECAVTRLAMNTLKEEDW